MANYTYLPWVRQGLIGVADSGVVADGRLKLEVSADIAGGSGGTTQPVQIMLFGPGDITSLDPKQVLRTDPPDHTSDFEPNYFPLIEFDRPDLPWMFTPAAPAGSNLLQPWLCLLVVERRAGVELKDSDGQGLPVLTIASAAHQELPDLSEAWAWVHAQVSAVHDAADLQNALTGQPERTLSRLMCPRRLKPRTAYYACVVPTYSGGVQAGLGEAMDSQTALDPAWTWTAQSPDKIRLPVYYRWEFATGAEGDFESLVWQLERRQLTFQEVGTRKLDISQAGYGLPASDPVDLEGALSPLPGSGDPALVGPSQAYMLRLQALLNGQALPPVPVLPPPIYGRWQAAERTIPDPIKPGVTRDRPWLRTLNLDPRYRAAAGVGTEVVRAQQEQLMAAAWEQVGDIERANQVIRQAQMSRAASKSIHEKRLGSLDASTFLEITGPLQPRVPYVAARSGQKATAFGHLLGSALPRAVTSAQFRRLLRPRGPAAKRFNVAGAAQRASLIAQLNRHQISAVPERWPTPDGMLTMENLLDKSPCKTSVIPLARALVKKWPAETLNAALEKSVNVFAKNQKQIAALGGQAARFLKQASKGLTAARKLLADYQAAESRNKGKFTLEAVIRFYKPALEAIELARWLEGRVIAMYGSAIPTVVTRLENAMNALPVEAECRKLLIGLAAIPLLEDVEPCSDKPPIFKPPLDIGELKQRVHEYTEPGRTIAARLDDLVQAPGWAAEDFEFVLAAPDFPTPMYSTLAEQSSDWLLPGLERIPPNTLAMLASNGRFIEAFLVGLNHEMSRELLWRGYPTDQRGTYFRQFWDPSGRFPAPKTEAERKANLEAGKDIPPIHEWQDQALGGDFGRTGSPAAGFAPSQTVLLLRGDLLRRYPHATIFAAKAEWSIDSTTGAKQAPRNPTAVELYPAFRGELAPDINFLGFDIDPVAARGTEVPTNDPADDGAGWFIVIQQQPTEPRYGLDESAASSNPTDWTWRDLAWPHVNLTESGGYIHLAASLAASFPGSAQTGPGGENWHWDKAATDGAQIACIALQGPVRVAIHASDLL